MKTRWYHIRDERAVTVTRALPPRFDLAVETILPRARLDRLAHQVRQDVWRALRNVRGFLPAVRAEVCGDGVRITAGGAAPVFPPTAREGVLAVLENPRNRARWLRHANRAAAEPSITEGSS